MAGNKAQEEYEKKAMNNTIGKRLTTQKNQQIEMAQLKDLVRNLTENTNKIQESINLSSESYKKNCRRKNEEEEENDDQEEGAARNSKALFRTNQRREGNNTN